MSAPPIGLTSVTPSTEATSDQQHSRRPDVPGYIAPRSTKQHDQHARTALIGCLAGIVERLPEGLEFLELGEGDQAAPEGDRADQPGEQAGDEPDRVIDCRVLQRR